MQRSTWFSSSIAIRLLKFLWRETVNSIYRAREKEMVYVDDHYPSLFERGPFSKCNSLTLYTYIHSTKSTLWSPCGSKVFHAISPITTDWTNESRFNCFASLNSLHSNHPIFHLMVQKKKKLQITLPYRWF